MKSTRSKAKMQQAFVRRAGAVALCAGLGMAMTSGAARGAQETAHWLNPVSGSWTDAAMWSTAPSFPNNGSPAGTTYHAVIDAAGGPYTVTLNSSVTLDQLTLDSASATLAQSGGTLTLHAASAISAGRLVLSAGSLDGAGDLTIGGRMDWSGGTMQGGGRVIVGSTGDLRILGSGPKQLARDLENQGVIRDPAGDIVLAAGAEVRNLGVIEFSNPSSRPRFKRSGEGTATFRNDGEIRVSQNTSAHFESGVMFLNHGLIETMFISDELRFLGGLTNAGEVRIGDGSFWVVSPFHNDGLIEILGPGLLRLGGPVTHGAASVVTGSGGLEFHSEEHFLSSQFAGCTGRITVSSGTLHVGSQVQPDRWRLTGGVTLFHDDRVLPAGSTMMGGDVGGEGRLWIESLDWNGGAFRSGGLTEVVAGGQLLIGAGTLSRTLLNSGVMEIDDGTLTISGGSLVNAGSLALSEDASIVGAGPESSLTNEGQIMVSGGRIVRVSGADLEFRNDGVIEIESGTTLRLSTDIAAGALGLVGGGGLLDFAGGQVVVRNGEIGVGCAVAVSGGAVLFEASPSVAVWSFSAGSAVFQSAFEGGSLLRTTGTALRFEGAVTLAADATIQLSGLGSMDFTDASVTASEVRLEGGTVLGDSDLIATSQFRWTGGTMGGGGRTIVGEQATALLGGFGTMKLERELVIEGAATWGNTWLRFDGGTLRNEGTLSAHQFQGTPGRMQALGDGGVFINSGTIVKSGDGGMELYQSDSVMRFENTGLLDVREGTVGLNGAALTTNEGVYAMSHAGSVAVGGAFENEAGAALAFEVGGMKERGLSGLMTITGEASLAGTLVVSTPEPFSAAWGDRWTIMTYGSLVGDFDSFDLPTEGFAARGDSYGVSDLRWYAAAGATEYVVGVSHIADIDHDGLIGFSDLNVIVSNFNTLGGWALGDVDGDGFVGFADLNLVASLFNVSAPRSVPAPGGVVVLGLAAAAGLGRRRGLGGVR